MGMGLGAGVEFGDYGTSVSRGRELGDSIWQGWDSGSALEAGLSNHRSFRPEIVVGELKMD